jgi:hypothetical protein
MPGSRSPRVGLFATGGNGEIRHATIGRLGPLVERENLLAAGRGEDREPPDAAKATDATEQASAHF